MDGEGGMELPDLQRQSQLKKSKMTGRKIPACTQVSVEARPLAKRGTSFAHAMLATALISARPPAVVLREMHSQCILNAGVMGPVWSRMRHRTGIRTSNAPGHACRFAKSHEPECWSLKSQMQRALV